MHGTSRHKRIAELRVQISPLSDDHAQVESESRRFKRVNGSQADRSPPPVELIPQPPLYPLPARFKKFAPFGTAYSGSACNGIDNGAGSTVAVASIPCRSRYAA